MKRTFCYVHFRIAFARYRCQLKLQRNSRQVLARATKIVILRAWIETNSTHFFFYQKKKNTLYEELGRYFWRIWQLAGSRISSLRQRECAESWNTFYIVFNRSRLPLFLFLFFAANHPSPMLRDSLLIKLPSILARTIVRMSRTAPRTFVIRSRPHLAALNCIRESR